MILSLYPCQLVASTDISSNGQSTGVQKGTVLDFDNLNADSVSIASAVFLAIAINTTAVPNGTTNTLDVYLQTSFDFGTTWADIFHIRYTTNPRNDHMLLTRSSDSVRRDTPQTIPLGTTNAALPLNQLLQFGWGDRLRLKWVFAAGDSTGNYTLNANYVSA
jgi:hypothetical protein